MKLPLCISFIGSSGSGKSTCFGIAEAILRDKGYKVLRLDVAYPLRQAQVEIHRIFNLESPGEADRPEEFDQDGSLMQYLTSRYLGEMLKSFTARFSELVEKNENEDLAFINTDCRQNAIKVLDELASWNYAQLFVEPGVLAERRLARGDLSPYNHTLAMEQVPVKPNAFFIDNSSSVEDLSKYVIDFIESVK